jgi:Protein of unknown function (DUF3619)
MKNEYEGTQQIRQGLEQGVQSLNATIAARLVDVRKLALESQKAVEAEPSLVANFANMGRNLGNSASASLLPHARMFVAITALTLGIAGTYYWNAFEQADENAEIDSALLGDDLPVAAYTDQGFEEWLDHTSRSSEQ